MLKNFANHIVVRNFIQAGFYIDHFIKTTISVFLNKSLLFVIVFNEKFFVDYSIKHTYDNIYTIKNKYLQTNYYFLQIFIVLFNIFVAVALLG